MMKNQKQTFSSSFVVTDNKNKTFECAICLNSFHTAIEPAFDTGECDHKTCQDCLRDYLRGVLTDTTCTEFSYIECPGTQCKKRYYSNEVIPIVFSPEEATDWWLSALCSKAYITNKVHCPHKGCGAVFDADDDHTKQCTFSECYQCHKGFCITCQTVWHPDEIKVVDESKSLIQALDIAKNKNWCKCPSCHNFVERTMGCDSVLCRCGKYFCYRCGGIMRGYGTCLNKCRTMSTEQLNAIRSTMYVNNDIKKK